MGHAIREAKFGGTTVRWVTQISPKGRFVAGDGDHSSESDEPWRCNNPPELFAEGKIWWGTPTGVDHQISPKGWFVAGDGDHSSESDEPWRCYNPPVPCVADISFRNPSANRIFYNRRVVQLRA